MKTSEKIYSMILLGLSIVLLGGLLSSVPSTISYQGRLTNSVGMPLDGVTVDLTFSIYDADTGGNLLWSESWPGVAVAGGMYRVNLGESNPIESSTLNGNDAWLEAGISGETVTSRQRIVSVPFALKAEGEVPEGGIILGAQSGDTAITGLGYSQQGSTIGAYYLYKKDVYNPSQPCVPQRIANQGRVMPADGGTVGSTADFTFTIYDADTAGSVLWSETQNSVSISEGLFSVELGAVNPRDKVEKVEKSELTMHNILEVLEVRKKIILPILDNIIAHPINCDQLIDNDKAFEELTNIYNRDEPINKYLDKEYNYEELLIAITPEMERQIQNKVEGHICFGFANRSTISALAGIWDQYPCTEAAACALAKINSILAIGNISYVYVNGKNVLFFKDEWTKLSDYIIMNYPDTWEAEAIKKWKVIKNNDMYSIEAMKAWENWIDFVENNDVLNNRYYKLNNTNYDVTRSFARAHYSTLSSIYLHRCDDAIDKKIIETGRIKIPPESIEMYNKHVELRQRERTKYPKYYREMSKLPRCYEMIRDHSPEHYKGDSPEPKKK